jgi:hypothetical protein
MNRIYLGKLLKNLAELKCLLVSTQLLMIAWDTSVKVKEAMKTCKCTLTLLARHSINL